MKITREELIQICKDAVVPCEKWIDRDSCAAQLGVQSIYAGLTAGVSYSCDIEDDTLWITFRKPTKNQKAKFEHLSVDTLDDYLAWYYKTYGGNSDPEMFWGCGIDWNSTYLVGYLPTRERLIEVNGGDWY